MSFGVSLPSVVYTPQGGTEKSALKGCLPRPTVCLFEELATRNLKRKRPE
jgi:hypothetical protein